MNSLIEKFGKYIYKKASSDPVHVRKLLCSVYTLAGFQARYLPSKALMPSRQYMAYVAAKSITKPLRHPERAAIVSIFTPCEMLHSLGIETMFPEGLSCYLAASASERFFIEKAEQCGAPESLCSYHKVLIGLVESGVMPKPLFVLNTTLACDANQLSFRKAAEFFDIPHFVIDVPNDTGKDAQEYVERQLKEIWEEIKKLVASEDAQKRLQDCIAKSKQTVSLYKEYLDLRAERSVSDEMTSEMLSVFAMHVLLGKDDALEYVKRLVDDTRKQPKQFKGKRIMWVHAMPYWQDSLREVLNFNDRCEIVGCDMTFDSLEGCEETDEFSYMAARTLKCSFNGSWERRAEKVRQYAQMMHADGIIYFCHWGCKQTMCACVLAKKMFESSSLPTLILDGDGCDTANISDGQMLTRVQAFIEQLEDKK